MRSLVLKSTSMLFGVASFFGVLATSPADALPIAPPPTLDSQLVQVQDRLIVYRRGARPAPRRVVRTVRPAARPAVRVVRPAARPVMIRPVPLRPAPVVRYAPRYYGTWYRPYRWRPGGAIVAGAAIGFLSAAAVGTYYYAVPRPPRPGLCWYYTNPARTSGFWDFCP
jgi:hypothetical protein